MNASPSATRSRISPGVLRSSVMDRKAKSSSMLVELLGSAPSIASLVGVVLVQPLRRPGKHECKVVSPRVPHVWVKIADAVVRIPMWTRVQCRFNNTHLRHPVWIAVELDFNDVSLAGGSLKRSLHVDPPESGRMGLNVRKLPRGFRYL